MSRNRNVDLLKAICSFMVVCIHIPFQGLWGHISTALSRTAVPLFFMITGYYYTHTKEQHREKRQLKKMFQLLLGANLFFLWWPALRNLIVNKTILPYLASQFNIQSTLKFLLLNISPLSGHLWYLGAILYVLLIVYFFEKIANRQKLYPLIPFLLLINLIFGRYSSVFLKQTISNVWTRNFLFLGLPYFLLGDLIYTRKVTVKSRTALVLALICASTIAIEVLLMNVYFNCAPFDHYLGTIFLAFFTFVFTVQRNSNRKGLRMFYYIGASLTTTIYIIHPYIILIMQKIVDLLLRFNLHFLEQAYQHLAPIWVFAVSAVLAWILGCVTTAIKTKFSSVRSKTA